MPPGWGRPELPAVGVMGIIINNYYQASRGRTSTGRPGGPVPGVARTVIFPHGFHFDARTRREPDWHRLDRSRWRRKILVEKIKNLYTR